MIAVGILDARTLPASLVERFYASVDSSAGVNECWPWTGALFASGGYGRLRSTRLDLRAHRVALSLNNGMPVSDIVLHSCDNPPCCNPAHLSEGTQADNMADARAKGRASRPPVGRNRGFHHSHAKLTQSALNKVRRLLAEGHTQRDIARAVGITQSTVSGIKNGRRWSSC